MQGSIGYTAPDTTYIYTPEIPLVLGTYARAIDERGEDDGEAFNKADDKYRTALNTAVLAENAATGDDLDWETE